MQQHTLERQTINRATPFREGGLATHVALPPIVFIALLRPPTANDPAEPATLKRLWISNRKPCC